MAGRRQTPRTAYTQVSRSPPDSDAVTPGRSHGERRPVTIKPPRPAPSRGSPPAADRSEAKLQEIVSVRFSDQELRRIQAFAVIFNMTPNAVIREAWSFFFSHKVGTPDYEEALEAYHRRTTEVVDVLEQINSAR